MGPVCMDVARAPPPRPPSRIADPTMAIREPPGREAEARRMRMVRPATCHRGKCGEEGARMVWRGGAKGSGLAKRRLVQLPKMATNAFRVMKMALA